MKKLFDLTYPQKSILLTERFYKNTPVNNICGTAIINEEVNFEALKKAVNSVIQDNDNFRIHLTQEKNEVKQYLAEAKDYDAEIVNIKEKEEIENIEKSMSQKVFSIFDNDLFEIKIFRLENNFGGFIVNIHHIISDGWTLGLVSRKIMGAYSKIIKNDEAEETKFSYIEYAENQKEYLNSEKFVKDKKYWMDCFKNNINPASLPSDKTINGSDLSCLGERLDFTISKTKMKAITEFCLNNGLTVFNFLMSIYSIYISKIINSTDFSIGTPILNRTNFKEKSIMGMFINIVPFRIKFDETTDFIEFASSIAKDTVSILRHQKYPYQLLLEEMRKSDSSIPNLYNIVISYQLTKANNECEYDYNTSWNFNKHSADDMSIQFFDLDEEGSLNVAYDFKKLKYSSDYVKNMHFRILELINKVLENKNILLKDIEVITTAEKNRILTKFNDTFIKYDKNKNVIKYFKEMVKRFPEKTAVICNNQKFTYKELDEKSDCLAMHLKNNGALPKNIIGLCVNRSLEMAVGLLAILKINATYLPIDPDYPKDRIEYMLEDSNAKMLLINEKTKNIIDDKINKIDISLNSEVFDKENISKIQNFEIEKILPEDLIYVIYTSGSTGKPKGVMLKHQNINNFLLGLKNRIDFDKNKVMVSITTICFDIFVLEFWGALTSGMTLVLANEKEQNNGTYLNKLCLENRVDMIQTTPSRFKILLENSDNKFIENMTDIMVGGESVPKSLVDKLFSITKANLFNMYGPTETAVWSTIKCIKPKENITIGTPIANTKCYILDKDKKLLPSFIPGELYIGGDGVSNGYLNREELTNEKFVESPFEKGTLIYNTNDLAYFTEKGEIVHLGRTDFQVKIRGYRIELEEIENKINKIPEIKNSVVISDKNQRYLICYYISEEEINSNEIANILLKDLPNYMIPSVFCRLDKFPLTPNGKLDRKKLPKTELENSNLEKCKTKTEKLLFKIISKILKTEEIDINAPFITIGLDSLGIIEVQTALLSYNYVLNTQDFYRFNTIKQLAENIDNNIFIYQEQDAQIPVKFKHKFDELLLAKKATNNDILGNVFLTGANGFIGIHILHELLKNTDSNIYCLVRGKTKKASEERLIDIYKFYFDEDISKLINNKIFVFNGNILKGDLELSKTNLENIVSNTKTVIHTAAKVKHYGDYEEFRKINTEGTKNVAEFAFSNKLRLIHISSISVSGNYLVKQDNRNVEFTENNLYIGQNYIDNVYVHSKFEAEKIILEYMEKGLTAQIHRIGILAGRLSDGVFQNNIEENAFYSRIKSMVTLSCVSEKMLNQKIEFTPVDVCTKAIVSLAKENIADNKVFHLYNHNFINISDVIEILNSFGSNIKIVSENEFKNRIIEISKSKDSKFLLGIINDLDNSEKATSTINYNFSVNIKSEYTQKYLKLLKCEWNETNKNYIRKLINYMKKVNFI